MTHWSNGFALKLYSEEPSSDLGWDISHSDWGMEGNWYNILFKS